MERDLIEKRSQAERAVADMKDGDLKVKAFEVILNHLLSDDERPAGNVETKRQRQKVDPAGDVRTGKTTGERILSLKTHGFFGTLRTIGEVREELATHGWHYPATGLSGPLQELMQRRELRRQKVADGKKKIYKYSNP